METIVSNAKAVCSRPHARYTETNQRVYNLDLAVWVISKLCVVIG
jgi:hypothetical protein